MVYSISKPSSMPTFTNPGMFNVSPWCRKVGGHPRRHLVIFGDLRVAATLCTHVEMCSIASRKKENSILEEMWLGHKF